MKGDVFFQLEVDVVGTRGVEGALGSVLDLDNLGESGYYYAGGLAGGGSIGVAFTGGYIASDIEGTVRVVDFNLKLITLGIILDTNGSIVGGFGGVGIGGGVSCSSIYTKTYITINSVKIFMSNLIN